MATQIPTILELPIVKYGNAAVKIETNLPAVSGDEVFVGENCGLFRIINQKDGDKRITWNRMSLSEIHDARQLFNELIEQGYVAHSVGVDGRASAEVMAEFDPSAEEIIMVPMAALAGG